MAQAWIGTATSNHWIISEMKITNKKLSCCYDSRSYCTLCVMWLVSEGTNRNLPEHAGTTFCPVHRPCEPQCTALQTDGRHDDANSWSYFV